MTATSTTATEPTLIDAFARPALDLHIEVHAISRAASSHREKVTYY